MKSNTQNSATYNIDDTSLKNEKPLIYVERSLLDCMSTIYLYTI